MSQRAGHGRSSTRTQTHPTASDVHHDDEAFELVTQLAEDANISRSRLLELLVGYDHEVYEQLTQEASGAEVGRVEFLERVVLLGRDPHERLTTLARRDVATGFTWIGDR